MQFVRCMKIGQLSSAVVLNLQPLGINGLTFPLDYGTEFVVPFSSRSCFLALKSSPFLVKTSLFV